MSTNEFEETPTHHNYVIPRAGCSCAHCESLRSDVAKDVEPKPSVDFSELTPAMRKMAADDLRTLAREGFLEKQASAAVKRFMENCPAALGDSIDVKMDAALEAGMIQYDLNAGVQTEPAGEPARPSDTQIAVLMTAAYDRAMRAPNASEFATNVMAYTDLWRLIAPK